MSLRIFTFYHDCLCQDLSPIAGIIPPGATIDNLFSSVDGFTELEWIFSVVQFLSEFVQQRGQEFDLTKLDTKVNFKKDEVKVNFCLISFSTKGPAFNRKNTRTQMKFSKVLLELLDSHQVLFNVLSQFTLNGVIFMY